MRKIHELQIFCKQNINFLQLIADQLFISGKAGCLVLQTTD
jgi:hypothetical protein